MHFFYISLHKILGFCLSLYRESWQKNESFVPKINRELIPMFFDEPLRCARGKYFLQSTIDSSFFVVDHSWPFLAILRILISPLRLATLWHASSSISRIVRRSSHAIRTSCGSTPLIRTPRVIYYRTTLPRSHFAGRINPGATTNSDYNTSKLLII